MSGDHILCHLSEGMRTRRKRPRTSRIKRRVLFFLLLVLSIALLINCRLSPLLLELARTEVERMSEQLLAEAIDNVLSRDDVSYRDIVTLTYKTDGSVAALRADTASLLRLRTQLSRAALLSLRSAESIPLSIPISSIFGFNAIPSSHSIQVSMRLSRSFNAYFTSIFEECGINQTRHTILFSIAVEVYVLIPSRAKAITVKRDLPLAETVIVGAVPDAYTHIHRLTDDITEAEIDDIYDFGAATN